MLENLESSQKISLDVAHVLVKKISLDVGHALVQEIYLDVAHF